MAINGLLKEWGKGGMTRAGSCNFVGAGNNVTFAYDQISQITRWLAFKKEVHFGGQSQ
jgi:hypothetical protein